MGRRHCHYSTSRYAARHSKTSNARQQQSKFAKAKKKKTSKGAIRKEPRQKHQMNWGYLILRLWLRWLPLMDMMLSISSRIMANNACYEKDPKDGCY
mmetsp:Transcript_14164/g.23080  ORF Transcript_14164/g.23080 Transcript_14164/m.23080 type:complete len:97 (+) Transcript_14164:314-604(+)